MGNPDDCNRRFPKCHRYTGEEKSFLKRDEAEIQLGNARNEEKEGMKQGGGRGMIGRVRILSLFFFGLGRGREREGGE